MDLLLLSVLVSAGTLPLRSESYCRSGCDLALASYYVSPKLNLTYISALFGLNYTDVLPYNPSIKNRDSIQAGSRVNAGSPCDCINADFLGRTFPYTTLPQDTYDRVAGTVFANLTTADWLARVNSYLPTRIPDGALINVTVNCSCGDPSVSRDYGLFVTYPLRQGENLSSVVAAFGFSSDQGLLQRYNPGVDFGAGRGIVFIPTAVEANSGDTLQRFKEDA